MVAYFLIFLNIPNECTLPVADADPDNVAYIASNRYLAITCSFLLGLSDACYNTQVFSILGGVWKDNSAPAFAIFKFVQSASAAIPLFYVTYITLYWQLLVVVVFDIVGTITFCLVEWSAHKREKLAPHEDTTCGVED